MRTPCWANTIWASLVISNCCLFGYSGNNNNLDDRLVSASNNFGFKLFDELVEEDLDKNIFISPSSVSIALAMTYNGAVGKTQEEMAKTLELQGMSLQELNQANSALMTMLASPDEKVQLKIANSFWADKELEFKPDFIKRNMDSYGAKITNLDLSDTGVPALINGWISENTHGKIDQVIEEIDRNTILFLINAIYFKGIWTVQFDKKQTKERAFILSDGSKKMMPMMLAQSDHFKYYRNENFHAFSLPYGSERVSMYVFLPDPDCSLKEFYKSLNAENWENWMSQFQKREIAVVLPLFKMEYEVKLNDALKALGMGSAFGRGANFEKMCSGGAFIDEVKHKTFVEVNEEGTEASAVTVVKMKKGGGPRTIYVNRPFFCAIRDNETGTLLFMGSIVEPSFN